MSRCPRPSWLTLFVAAVAVGAALIVALSWLLPGEPVEWAWWGALGLLAAARLAEAGIVEVSRDSDEGGYGVSVATVPHIASALLLPVPLGALLAGAGMLLDELQARSSPSKLAFNVASTTLSVGVAALMANQLGISGAGLIKPGWLGLGAFLAVAIAYYAINTVPVACVGAIAASRPLGTAVLVTLRTTAPTELALTLLGGLAAFVWVANPQWLLVGASPVIVAQLTLRYIAQRNRKAAQLSSLDRLGHQLSTVLGHDEVFHIVSSQLRGLRSLDGCFLALSMPPVHLTDGLASGATELAFAGALTAEIEATGETIAVREGSPRLAEVESEARNWLVLSLADGADRLGCLGLVSRTSSAFGKEDREFFALVAERIALALQVARRAADLRRMAFHDVLTGLPNRALFATRLDEALTRAAHHGWTVALLYLDLDNFRTVNETFGHQAGDALLTEVASRLAACAQDAERNSLDGRTTLARLGGDEFTILIDRVDSPSEAVEIAQQLIAALRNPIQVSDHELVVGASIGIALSDQGRDHPESLLRCADLALYKAKANGKGDHVVFDPSIETHALERLQLESDLRAGLERGELRVYYQPIMRLDTGGLAGWEALVRWEHPTRGLIQPSIFIPIAEDSGLIVPLGQWVLVEACRQARRWSDEFPSEPPRTMSVNLSARQFAHPRLVDDIDAALRAVAMDPRDLVLEITESVVMQDAAEAITILHRLHQLGIRIAIDDFGTGYSSLAYLKRFPVDALKIDRSFVEGLGLDEQDTAIVRSVVALAGSLGLRVTAEGIETPRQLQCLEQLGCDQGQGYLFGAPRSAETSRLLLAEQSLARLSRPAA